MTSTLDERHNAGSGGPNVPISCAKNLSCSYFLSRLQAFEQTETTLSLDYNSAVFYWSHLPCCYAYMAIAQIALDHQSHELDLGLSGGYRLGWIIGGCDFLHACAAIGEASVRMTLPTPMKTLNQSVSIQQNDIWGRITQKWPPIPPYIFPTFSLRQQILLHTGRL